MAPSPANLWTLLDKHWPLNGPRRHLQGLLGAGVIAALEQVGILRQLRNAYTYPCPMGSLDGCPRTIVEIEDVYHGVCGNGPAECPDIVLTAADIGFLVLNPMGLCRAVASALQIRGTPEAIASLEGIWRVGTFIPEPGVKHPVFLVVRANVRGYTTAFEVLRSRQDGQPLAVLILTDRFLSDELARQMRAVGITVVVLHDAIGEHDFSLVPLADPLRLFAGLGQRPSRPIFSSDIVAQALVRMAGQPPSWIDIDRRQIDELRSATDRYDVFADEGELIVRKRSDVAVRKVHASYFRIIHAAVSKAGRFDPNIESDLDSGKQIFQRARSAFDLKTRSSWRIFKSVETDEGHTVYSFAPDADVSFAFIFLPER